jgi:hypothetical protein
MSDKESPPKKDSSASYLIESDRLYALVQFTGLGVLGFVVAVMGSDPTTSLGQLTSRTTMLGMCAIFGGCTILFDYLERLCKFYYLFASLKNQSEGLDSDQTGTWIYKFAGWFFFLKQVCAVFGASFASIMMAQQLWSK